VVVSALLLCAHLPYGRKLGADNYICGDRLLGGYCIYSRKLIVELSSWIVGYANVLPRITTGPNVQGKNKN